MLTVISVALARTTERGYPEHPPFHPGEAYPEFAGGTVGHERNIAYSMVRNALANLGCDAARFGTADWNPLGDFITRGSKVVVKPNFVMHEFGALLGTQCMTTHGSVIRAVVDYAFKATGSEGSITIADAPVQGADFDQLLHQNGVDAIREFYRTRHRFDLAICDLRQLHAVIDEKSAFIKHLEPLPGDPKGYSIIDLDGDSRLAPLDQPGTKYVVGDYDSDTTNTRHQSNHHEYVVSNTILDADTMINVPKLKTHSKVGVTVSLKNMIGIIGSKDCLPHHREGVSRNGDEFPEGYPRKWLIAQRVRDSIQGKVPVPVWRAARKTAALLLGAGTPAQARTSAKQTRFFPSGNWYGNDTIWRTVDDLNRIVNFYDWKRQVFEKERTRRQVIIVDGIIAMEGNGPLRGSPRDAGVVLAGTDPVAGDVVAATLMGFDWHRINMLRGIADGGTYTDFHGDPDELRIVTGNNSTTDLQAIRAQALNLMPPSGWVGHVESSIAPTKP